MALNVVNIIVLDNLHLNTAIVITTDHDGPFPQGNAEWQPRHLDVLPGDLVIQGVKQKLDIDGRISLLSLDGLLDDGLHIRRQLAGFGLRLGADREQDGEQGDDQNELLHDFPPMQLKTATSV